MITTGPIIFTGIEGVCLWGDQIFLGGQRGGDQNFSGSKRGAFTLGGPDFFHEAKEEDQIFFTHAKGGPEKIGDRPPHTDDPLPGKNDSFLKCFTRLKLYSKL